MKIGYFSTQEKGSMIERTRTQPLSLLCDRVDVCCYFVNSCVSNVVQDVLSGQRSDKVITNGVSTHCPCCNKLEKVLQVQLFTSQ